MRARTSDLIALAREGRLEQVCPRDCREGWRKDAPGPEAAGFYCTACGAPTNASDWRPTVVTDAQRLARQGKRRSTDTKSAGQAIVETALVLPLLLSIILVTIEAGSLLVRWQSWTRLASLAADGYARTGDVPAWVWDVAAAELCGAAELTVDDGEPIVAHLDCTYTAVAVNGFAPRVAVTGYATAPATPAPSEGGEPSPVTP